MGAINLGRTAKDRRLGLAMAAAALALCGGAAQAQTACADLAKLSLPQVEITSAAEVAGEGGAGAYCKVLATGRPTSDSDIRIEVLIPAGGRWNGRFVQQGNGGFAGMLPERQLQKVVAQGYATAGTDDGHQSPSGTDARWSLGHKEKQIDFGYRALKMTTDAAKAIVRAYAGAAPRYSYFAGCSDGGREALMEVQRYPADFDGVVAGAPANAFTHLLAQAAWNYQSLNATPDSYLPPDKLKLVEAEVLKQCGDETGVVENPLACHFDPARLRCPAGDGATCLKEAQVVSLTRIYGGLKDARTGAQIQSGFTPGAEAEPGAWVQWITGPAPGGQAAASYQFGSNFWRYLVFSDPGFDLMKLDFASAMAVSDQKMAPILDSTSTDLSAFKARGGKLIQYHGWNDPAIPAQSSIDYYRQVQARMGPTADFYRLFMAPGMLHCGSGPGPNVLSSLPAISAWVEQGKAPAVLTATKYAGDNPAQAVVRTRPLCPWPARAEWDGQGDKNHLESFRCVADAGAN